MEVAKLGTLKSTHHKGFLIVALIMHAMRSVEFMSTAITRAEAIGIDKWEYFKMLKDAWGSRLTLERAVTVPVFAKWSFWHTDSHAFPLCDSPVMMDRDSIMAVLSPRLLLEIDLNVSKPENHWSVSHDIPKHKMAEFRRRSIRNTFKEVIHSDPQTLTAWLDSDHAKTRILALRNKLTARELKEEAFLRVAFGINGFGRLPANFMGSFGRFLP